MARWINAKDAVIVLGKHANQIAVDYCRDKKMGWNRRIEKREDGRLYVNVDAYRSQMSTNELTKKRIEALYFFLYKQYECETHMIQALNEFLPYQSFESIYMYFRHFSFKNRKSALKYYLALNALKRSLTCQNIPMTLSTNAA